MSARRKFNWKRFWRIVLATQIFHQPIAAIAILLDPAPPSYAPWREILLSFVPNIFYALVPYWTLFVAACLTMDESNPVNEWRIWGAYSVITGAFAVVYLYLIFSPGPHPTVLEIFWLSTIFAAPLTTYVGVAAGTLAFRLISRRGRKV